MNDSISRQAVEKAAASAEAGLTFKLDYECWPDFDALYHAAQAILDGEPVEWCVEHDKPCRNLAKAKPCRFESRVLVRVIE